MAEETITLRLVAQDLMSGNVSKAISGLDAMAKQGGLVGSVLQGVGQKFGQMLNPVGLATDAFGAVTDIISDTTKAFREDALSQEQLRAALEANIPAWDGNTAAIEDVIAARMKLGFSDDQQRSSLAQLVAMTKDYKAALDIERTAMDLARLKSISLEDASTALGKAYTGSATALGRMGIKLAAGTKGVEALAAVQERVAGQAEAYAKTSTGAMEALDVKVGELKEKLGGFLEGPADLFVGWASNVVDVLDGPDGANKQLRDLAAQIYAVRQAASPTGEELLAGMSDQLQRWADTLKLQELNGTPESFAWLEKIGPSALRNFGAASADTLADVRALAQALIDKYGASEATFQKFRAAVDEIALPSFNILTDTWGKLPASAEAAFGGVSGALDDAITVTEKGAREFSHDMNRMRFAVGHATSDMLRTMDEAKDPWREAWSQMAAWAKDPFNEKRFAAWIKSKADKAAQNAVDAAKNHQAAAARRWQAIADAMKSPVLAAAIEMGASIDVAIAAILRAKNLGSTLGPLGPGGTGGTIQDSMPNHPQSWWDAHPGAAHRWGHRVTPHRNRNNDSTDTTDNRPPDQGPNAFTPNVYITVNSLVPPTEADGQRLARTIVPHIRRELARQVD